MAPTPKAFFSQNLVPPSAPRSPLSLVSMEAFCVYKDNVPLGGSHRFLLLCTQGGNKGDVEAAWDGISRGNVHCGPHLCSGAQIPISLRVRGRSTYMTGR